MMSISSILVGKQPYEGLQRGGMVQLSGLYLVYSCDNLIYLKNGYIANDGILDRNVNIEHF